MQTSTFGRRTATGFEFKTNGWILGKEEDAAPIEQRPDGLVHLNFMSAGERATWIFDFGHLHPEEKGPVIYEKRKRVGNRREVYVADALLRNEVNEQLVAELEGSGYKRLPFDNKYSPRNGRMTSGIRTYRSFNRHPLSRLYLESCRTEIGGKTVPLDQLILQNGERRMKFIYYHDAEGSPFRGFAVRNTKNLVTFHYADRNFETPPSFFSYVRIMH